MRGVKSAISVLVALGLLVGLAWLGELWARSEVESRIESAVSEQLPEVSGAEASVSGRFVLPQLVGGTLEQVTVTAPEAIVDGIAVTDIVAVADQVPVRGDGTVATVEVTGTVPLSSVVSAVERRVDLPDGVELELRDGDIVLTASVLGIPLEAFVSLAAEPRAITFEIDRFMLGGSEVSADDIPLDLNAMLGDTRITLDALPESMELTELEVTADGLDLVLHGTDVEL